MRVFIALAFFALSAQAAVNIPCGQPNEARVFVSGASKTAFQGFYATPSSLTSVIDALIAKHVAANVPNSAVVGWVEVEGSADAYLVISYITVEQTTSGASSFKLAGSQSAGPTYGTATISNPDSTTTIISLLADGPGFSGWVALPFALNAGVIPTPASNFIDLSYNLESFDGEDHARSVFNNTGSASASGAALNVVTLSALQTGPVFSLGDATNTPKGAFVANSWRACPTGCVDAKGDACTSVTKDDDCTSVKAESGASTCVSLKFTTSGASC